MHQAMTITHVQQSAPAAMQQNPASA